MEGPEPMVPSSRKPRHKKGIKATPARAIAPEDNIGYVAIDILDETLIPGNDPELDQYDESTRKMPQNLIKRIHTVNEEQDDIHFMFASEMEFPTTRRSRWFTLPGTKHHYQHMDRWSWYSRPGPELYYKHQITYNWSGYVVWALLALVAYICLYNSPYEDELLVWLLVLIVLLLVPELHDYSRAGRDTAAECEILCRELMLDPEFFAYMQSQTAFGSKSVAMLDEVKYVANEWVKNHREHTWNRSYKINQVIRVIGACMMTTPLESATAERLRAGNRSLWDMAFYRKGGNLPGGGRIPVK
jgi:hypothetical protein